MPGRPRGVEDVAGVRLHAWHVPRRTQILALAEIDVAGPAQCGHSEAETGNHHFRCAERVQPHHGHRHLALVQPDVLHERL
jgi:hypothetical protein